MIWYSNALSGVLDIKCYTAFGIEQQVKKRFIGEVNFLVKGDYNQD
jgi:hypothetical protein